MVKLSRSLPVQNLKVKIWIELDTNDEQKKKKK